MAPTTGPVGELAAARPRRSSGVTLIGVLFLTLGAMWMLASLFQGVFFTLLASMRPGGVALDEITNDPNVPVALRFMVHYARFFWMLSVGVAAVLTVCSAGLLRRKNWARLVFLLISCVGIVYSLVSLAASAMLAPFFQSQMGNLDSLGVGAAMSTMATVVVAIVVVKSLFMVVFFGWMLRKLTRPEVKAEFV